MLVASPLLLLVAPALAGGKSEVSIETIEIAHEGLEYGIVVITGDPDTATASMTAEVESDGGAEDVVLTESDAWLHGAAAVAALPKSAATVTLTVYDNSSAPLASFTGALAEDGTVSRMVRADHCGDGTVRTPCEAADLDLLAAELVPGTGSTYDATFDLVGADTYTVAYADVVVTEGKTSTRAEVGWQAVGAVWTGTLAETHDGLVEVKVKARDGEGEKLTSKKAKLGMPLADGGAGVGTLATDDDPLTRVALIMDQLHNAGTVGFLVVSDGWSLDDELPVDAEVALDEGETLVVPANSYQVTAATPVVVSGSPEKEAFQVTIDGTVVKGGASVGDRGLCQSGTCVALAQDDDGAWTLSATAYAASSTTLPTSVKVSLASTLKAAATKEASYTLTYGDEVSVVFANAAVLAADPVGVDLTGKVSLLGAANKKGKQETLAKGKFYGSFTRDGDGELALGGADKDDVQAKGDILIGGEPIDFELTDTDGDGVVLAPPAVSLRVAGNGKGTRIVATTSTVNPGLL